MKARVIETIPPIRNLMPMISKPSPSSLGDMTLVPIQIQITPKAPTIVPAANSGLNNMVFSLTNFDITAQDRMRVL